MKVMGGRGREAGREGYWRGRELEERGGKGNCR